jgi:16S rRNA (cytosine1402-N4)-methyltransferase
MTEAAMDKAAPHRPVLLAEVIEALSPRDGAIYVDGTFGAGGYSRALLEAAQCTVFAIDRDPDAVKGAAPLIDRYPGRLHILQGRFGDMFALLGARGIDAVQGVALDLGVSSMQLDRAERGFSFRFEGPLDMRMERAGRSAADLVNELAERPLADLIFTFGEEKKARRIAKAIVAARALAPISTTQHLAEIVRRAIGPAHDRIDPATRTFQALRIAVNDELAEIDRGLGAAERLLAPGGRLAILMGDLRRQGRYEPLTVDVARLDRDSLEGIIVKVQHNVSSNRTRYSGKFVPILHETLTVFRK